MTWIVEWDGEFYGPFASEDECYLFAAQVSSEPNDWTPSRLLAPADGIDRATEGRFTRTSAGAF